MVILNVGTFDDPSVAKAGRETFRDDGLRWIEVHGDPALRKTGRLNA